MDAIGVTCSDGTVLGPAGGTGGSAASSSTCPSGFSSVQETFVTDYGWNSIGGILVSCGGTQSGVMGFNSGSSQTFSCPAGQRLNGVSGTQGVGSGYYSHCTCQVVYSLRFSCVGTGKHFLFQCVRMFSSSHAFVCNAVCIDVPNKRFRLDALACAVHACDNLNSIQ